MQTYLNETGVPLSVAVYLATDHYDYIPGTISATGLMQPIRQQVLQRRIKPGSPESLKDVLSVVKSRMGTSIHDGLEKVWRDGHYKQAMLALGYPENVVKRIVVNPPLDKPLPKGAIPVYLEIRSKKEVDGEVVTGKFDFAAEGRIQDYKNTSTYSWINNNKYDDYRIQGSIYRWLNPEIITEDTMAIQFFFSDWMPGKASQDPAYPQRITEQLLIPLMSIEETEQYVKSRIALRRRYMNSPEHELPECTDKELWRGEPTYKYYRNPDDVGVPGKRSTRTSENLEVVQAAQEKNKGAGVIVKIPAKAVACGYCPAFTLCTQKDRLAAEGALKN